MLRVQIANDFTQYPSFITRDYDRVEKILKDLGKKDKEFTAREIGERCGGTIAMLVRYGVLEKVGKVETLPITVDVSQTMDYFLNGKRYRAKPCAYRGGYELEKPYDHSYEVRRECGGWNGTAELVRRYEVDHISITPKVNVYRFPFATREDFADNILANIREGLLN